MPSAIIKSIEQRPLAVSPPFSDRKLEGSYMRAAPCEQLAAMGRAGQQRGGEDMG